MAINNMNADRSSIRDASERFNRTDARQRASEVLEDASERASEFYDTASTWVTENYGRSLAAVAVLAAVGVIGYMIGKNARTDFSDY